MLTFLYTLIIALSVLTFFVILKKTGVSGIFIILGSLLVLIPDRFLIQELTENYLESINEREGSLGVWLEIWMSLRIALSLILVLVGFSLFKKDKTAEPDGIGQ